MHLRVPMDEDSMVGLRSTFALVRISRRKLHRGQQRDFETRLSFSHPHRKKEASESKLWLRLLGETSENESTKSTLRVLFKESDELTRILATILRNSK